MPSMEASSPAHFLITLDFADAPPAIRGAWMRKSGGNGTATIRRFHPGGSADEEIAGGPKSRDDMTVSREFRADRDRAVYVWADRKRGQARGSVTVQPLDGDFAKFGAAVTYSAILMGANLPDVDSDAGGDIAMIELTLATYGEVA